MRLIILLSLLSVFKIGTSSKILKVPKKGIATHELILDYAEDRHESISDWKSHSDTRPLLKNVPKIHYVDYESPTTSLYAKSEGVPMGTGNGDNLAIFDLLAQLNDGIESVNQGKVTDSREATSNTPTVFKKVRAWFRHSKKKKNKKVKEDKGPRCKSKKKRRFIFKSKQSALTKTPRQSDYNNIRYATVGHIPNTQKQLGENIPISGMTPNDFGAMITVSDFEKYNEKSNSAKSKYTSINKSNLDFISEVKLNKIIDSSTSPDDKLFFRKKRHRDNRQPYNFRERYISLKHKRSASSSKVTEATTDVPTFEKLSSEIMAFNLINNYLAYTTGGVTNKNDSVQSSTMSTLDEAKPIIISRKVKKQEEIIPQGIMIVTTSAMESLLKKVKLYAQTAKSNSEEFVINIDVTSPSTFRSKLDSSYYNEESKSQYYSENPTIVTKDDIESKNVKREIVHTSLELNTQPSSKNMTNEFSLETVSQASTSHDVNTRNIETGTKKHMKKFKGTIAQLTCKFKPTSQMNMVNKGVEAITLAPRTLKLNNNFEPAVTIIEKNSQISDNIAKLNDDYMKNNDESKNNLDLISSDMQIAKKSFEAILRDISNVKDSFNLSLVEASTTQREYLSNRRTREATINSTERILAKDMVKLNAKSNSGVSADKNNNSNQKYEVEGFSSTIPTNLKKRRKRSKKFLLKDSKLKKVDNASELAMSSAMSKNLYAASGNLKRKFWHMKSFPKNPAKAQHAMNKQQSSSEDHENVLNVNPVSAFIEDDAKLENEETEYDNRKITMLINENDTSGYEQSEYAKLPVESEKVNENELNSYTKRSRVGLSNDKQNIADKNESMYENIMSDLIKINRELFMVPNGTEIPSTSCSATTQALKNCTKFYDIVKKIFRRPHFKSNKKPKPKRKPAAKNDQNNTRPLSSGQEEMMKSKTFFDVLENQVSEELPTFTYELENENSFGNKFAAIDSAKSANDIFDDLLVSLPSAKQSSIANYVIPSNMFEVSSTSLPMEQKQLDQQFNIKNVDINETLKNNENFNFAEAKNDDINKLWQNIFHSRKANLESDIRKVTFPYGNWNNNNRLDNLQEEVSKMSELLFHEDLQNPTLKPAEFKSEIDKAKGLIPSFKYESKPMFYEIKMFTDKKDEKHNKQASESMNNVEDESKTISDIYESTTKKEPDSSYRTYKNFKDNPPSKLHFWADTDVTTKFSSVKQTKNAGKFSKKFFGLKPEKMLSDSFVFAHSLFKHNGKGYYIVKDDKGEKYHSLNLPNGESIKIRGVKYGIVPKSPVQNPFPKKDNHDKAEYLNPDYQRSTRFVTFLKTENSPKSVDSTAGNELFMNEMEKITKKTLLKKEKKSASTTKMDALQHQPIKKYSGGGLNPNPAMKTSGHIFSTSDCTDTMNTVAVPNKTTTDEELTKTISDIDFPKFPKDNDVDSAAVIRSTSPETIQKEMESILTSYKNEIYPTKQVVQDFIFQNRPITFPTTRHILKPYYNEISPQQKSQHFIIDNQTLTPTTTSHITTNLVTDNNIFMNKEDQLPKFMMHENVFDKLLVNSQKSFFPKLKEAATKMPEKLSNHKLAESNGLYYRVKPKKEAHVSDYFSSPVIKYERSLSGSSQTLNLESDINTSINNSPKRSFPKAISDSDNVIEVSFNSVDYQGPNDYNNNSSVNTETNKLTNYNNKFEKEIAKLDNVPTYTTSKKDTSFEKPQTYNFENVYDDNLNSYHKSDVTKVTSGPIINEISEEKVLDDPTTELNMMDELFIGLSSEDVKSKKYDLTNTADEYSKEINDNTNVVTIDKDESTTDVDADNEHAVNSDPLGEGRVQQMPHTETFKQYPEMAFKTDYINEQAPSDYGQQNIPEKRDVKESQKSSNPMEFPSSSSSKIDNQEPQTPQLPNSHIIELQSHPVFVKQSSQVSQAAEKNGDNPMLMKKLYQYSWEVVVPKKVYTPGVRSATTKLWHYPWTKKDPDIPEDGLSSWQKNLEDASILLSDKTDTQTIKEKSKPTLKGGSAKGQDKSNQSPKKENTPKSDLMNQVSALGKNIDLSATDATPRISSKNKPNNKAKDYSMNKFTPVPPLDNSKANHKISTSMLPGPVPTVTLLKPSEDAKTASIIYDLFTTRRNKLRRLVGKLSDKFKKRPLSTTSASKLLSSGSAASECATATLAALSPPPCNTTLAALTTVAPVIQTKRSSLAKTQTEIASDTSPLANTAESPWKVTTPERSTMNNEDYELDELEDVVMGTSSDNLHSKHSLLQEKHTGNMLESGLMPRSAPKYTKMYEKSTTKTLNDRLADKESDKDKLAKKASVPKFNNKLDILGMPDGNELTALKGIGLEEFGEFNPRYDGSNFGGINADWRDVGELDNELKEIERNIKPVQDTSISNEKKFKERHRSKRKKSFTRFKMDNKDFNPINSELHPMKWAQRSYFHKRFPYFKNDLRTKVETNKASGKEKIINLTGKRSTKDLNSKKQELNSLNALLLKKEVKREIPKAIRKILGFNDHVCTCKCHINHCMCKSCAASSEVISELMFEFQNIAKYMEDHCTEIQNFFWVNPTEGRKLRGVVRDINRMMENYFKRVKRKCKGISCSTLNNCIEKRSRRRRQNWVQKKRNVKRELSLLMQLTEVKKLALLADKYGWSCGPNADCIKTNEIFNNVFEKCVPDDINKFDVETNYNEKISPMHKTDPNKFISDIYDNNNSSHRSPFSNNFNQTDSSRTKHAHKHSKRQNIVENEEIKLESDNPYPVSASNNNKYRNRSHSRLNLKRYPIALNKFRDYLLKYHRCKDCATKTTKSMTNQIERANSIRSIVLDSSQMRLQKNREGSPVTKKGKTSKVKKNGKMKNLGYNSVFNIKDKGIFETEIPNKYNNVEQPLISDSGGRFWYDYLKRGIKSNRLARHAKKLDNETKSTKTKIIDYFKQRKKTAKQEIPTSQKEDLLMKVHKHIHGKLCKMQDSTSSLPLKGKNQNETIAVIVKELQKNETNKFTTMKVYSENYPTMKNTVKQNEKNGINSNFKNSKTTTRKGFDEASIYLKKEFEKNKLMSELFTEKDNDKTATTKVFEINKASAFSVQEYKNNQSKLKQFKKIKDKDSRTNWESTISKDSIGNGSLNTMNIATKKYDETTLESLEYALERKRVMYFQTPLPNVTQVSKLPKFNSHLNIFKESKNLGIDDDIKTVQHNLKTTLTILDNLLKKTYANSEYKPTTLNAKENKNSSKTATKLPLLMTHSTQADKNNRVLTQNKNNKKTTATTNNTEAPMSKSKSLCSTREMTKITPKPKKNDAKDVSDNVNFVYALTTNNPTTKHGKVNDKSQEEMVWTKQNNQKVVQITERKKEKTTNKRYNDPTPKKFKNVMVFATTSTTKINKLDKVAFIEFPAETQIERLVEDNDLFKKTNEEKKDITFNETLSKDKSKWKPTKSMCKLLKKFMMSKVPTSINSILRFRQNNITCDSGKLSESPPQHPIKLRQEKENNRQGLVFNSRRLRNKRKNDTLKSNNYVIDSRKEDSIKKMLHSVWIDKCHMLCFICNNDSSCESVLCSSANSIESNNFNQSENKNTTPYDSRSGKTISIIKPVTSETTNSSAAWSDLFQRENVSGPPKLSDDEDKIRSQSNFSSIDRCSCAYCMDSTENSTVSGTTNMPTLSEVSIDSIITNTSSLMNIDSAITELGVLPEYDFNMNVNNDTVVKRRNETHEVTAELYNFVTEKCDDKNASVKVRKETQEITTELDDFPKKKLDKNVVLKALNKTQVKAIEFDHPVTKKFNDKYVTKKKRAWHTLKVKHKTQLIPGNNVSSTNRVTKMISKKKTVNSTCKHSQKKHYKVNSNVTKEWRHNIEHFQTTNKNSVEIRSEANSESTRMPVDNVNKDEKSAFCVPKSPNANCICDMDATIDRLVESYRKMNPSDFERLAERLSCHRYVKMPECLIVKMNKHRTKRSKIHKFRAFPKEIHRIRSLKLDDIYERTGRYRFDWIRHKRSAGTGTHRKTRVKRKTNIDLSLVLKTLKNLSDFETEKGEIYVQEGESVTLPCADSARAPGAAAAWGAERAAMLDLSNVAEQADALTVHSVTLDNMGGYSCSENGELLSSHRITVVSVPQYTLVYLAEYDAGSLCGNDELRALRWGLAAALERALCAGGRLCTVRARRLQCTARDERRHIGATLTVRVSGCGVECGARCARTLRARLAALVVEGAPPALAAPLLLSHRGGNRSLRSVAGAAADEESEWGVVESLNIKEREAPELAGAAAQAAAGELALAVSCAAGGYLQRASHVCVACPMGYFSRAGATRCTRCAPGRGTRRPGATRCVRNSRRYRLRRTSGEVVLVGCVLVCVCLAVLLVLSCCCHGEKTCSSVRWGAGGSLQAVVSRALSPSRVILGRAARRCRRQRDAQQDRRRVLEEVTECPRCEDSRPPLPPIDFDL